MTSNATGAASASASASASTTTAAITTTNSTTVATAVASARPQFLQQRPSLPPSQVQNGTRPQFQSISLPIPVPVPVSDQLPPLRYPLSSSGRGFINSTPNPNPNPNPNLLSYPVPPRSTMGYPPRPFGFAPSPPPLVKGFPVSAHPHHFKVGSSLTLPESFGAHKALSDRVRDDVCVFSVRDRKVRITDGASLYALCRSWLRNGHPEESQPQFGGIVKSLPKPAPASSSDNSSPKSNDAEEGGEKDMDEKSVESLSSEELLQLHIKRAKRVRERLREERLRRIARYKSRLALLLPPLVEQCRNDPTDGA